MVIAASIPSSEVTPGLLGFIVVVGLAVAVFFLLRSMNKQLRKVSSQQPRGKGTRPGPGGTRPGQGPGGTRPGPDNGPGQGRDNRPGHGNGGGAAPREHRTGS